MPLEGKGREIRLFTMTRILVPRGSSGGSSQNPNPNRTGSSSAQPEPVSPVHSAAKDEESGEEAPGQVVGDELLEYAGTSECNKARSDDPLMETLHFEQDDPTSLGDEIVADAGEDVKEEVAGPHEVMRGFSGERPALENEESFGDSSLSAGGRSHPPPPPVPPPKPSGTNLSPRRTVSGTSNAVHVGSSRRTSGRAVVSVRTSPAGSRPSSPRAHNESEGYNSADEQNLCFVSSYDDLVS